MQVRSASDKDIPAIIGVLKASLGEGSSPKTEAYWRWKHLENPFGTSLVLLAEDEGQVIGVRAMMNWCWQAGDRRFKALRAVDTATHPGFQGRGIFTKLTGAMVENAVAEHYDFIFNTPNSNSLPGYLKMGWKPAGKLKVGFTLKLPSSRIPDISATADRSSTCEAWNAMMEGSGKMFTPKSAAYLAWRYDDNPVVKYSIMEDEGIFIAATVRKRKWLNELRISELIFCGDKKKKKAKINEMVAYLAWLHNAVLVTCSPNAGSALGVFQLDLGPMLTLRGLQTEPLPGLGSWNHCIGDLELF